MSVKSKEITKAVKEVAQTEPLIVKDEQGNIVGEFDASYIDVIKKTVAKGATDAELYMFMAISASYGLNPFKKEIWFTKYGGKMNIMVSRDGYMKLAKEDPNFISCTSDVVCENDEFSMKRDLGKVTAMPHSYDPTQERGKIVGAYAVLNRRDGDPIIAFADFKEYNTKQSVWKTYPMAMIRKVAEELVCKQFAGITGVDPVETMPQQFINDANRKNVGNFNVIDTEIID